MADKQSARGGARRSPDSLPTKSWMDWRNAAAGIRTPLDNNKAVKLVVGTTARNMSQPAGGARGILHTVSDVMEAARFFGGLSNPILDMVLNGPSRSSVGRLVTMADAGATYAKRVAADPHVVVSDVKKAGGNFRRRIDPSATPMAPTLAQEVQRNVDIGLNQGELAFDVASTAYGAPAVKGLSAFPRVATVMEAAAGARAGRTAAQIKRLDELYDGMGSHYIPRRFTKGLPDWIRDNPFFVYKPAIPREDFYIRHAQVDPLFKGARLPGRPGWSAKKLGIKPFSFFDRHAFGMPAPLRALAIANAASATDSLSSMIDDGGSLGTGY